MVPWWIFMVFLLSIGFAQKNCGKTRVVFPAPVFGDGENLSAEGCGIWDQKKNEFAPWYAFLRLPRGGGCWGTLLSPTSVLGYDCEWFAEEFAKSENKDDWSAELGKCVDSRDYVKCVEKDEGQIVKIQNVTKLNATGYPDPIHIWKIEKTTSKENFIAPICFFNKGNLQDFNKSQQYTAFDYWWKRDYQLSTELSEDFGLCLRKSWNFRSCDKVHDNFLCAHLSRNDVWYRDYLSHTEKNRHFLRALRVEDNESRYKFYYELVPLLDQIVSATGDIPLILKIPEVKNKTDFKDGQSFPGCGTTSSPNRRRRETTTESTNFILRGKNAAKKEHPWHAAFVDGTGNVFCGGSLISLTATLTAAHCFFHPNGDTLHSSEFLVSLGTTEIKKIRKKGVVIGRQQATPDNVIIHSGYTHLKKDNDLAIVLLKEPGVAITPYVRPICLWKDDYQFDKINNKKGKVTGWGYMQNGTRPNKLKVAELRLVPYQECYLMNSHFFNQYLKPGLNFCAGEKGVNTCMGDSGEGFSVADEGRWYLRGVVSFGHTELVKIDEKKIPVCQGNIPSLYTDVTYHMDWIVQKANLTYGRIQN